MIELYNTHHWKFRTLPLQMYIRTAHYNALNIFFYHLASELCTLVVFVFSFRHFMYVLFILQSYHWCLVLWFIYFAFFHSCRKILVSLLVPVACLLLAWSVSSLSFSILHLPIILNSECSVQTLNHINHACQYIYIYMYIHRFARVFYFSFFLD